MGLREIVRPNKISDEHLVSEIGGLYARGLISLAEYEAGIKYGTIILNYLKTIDAPGPYSSERCESFTDEKSLRRKLRMAAARHVMHRLDRRCARVVDRVAVYGEPIYNDDIHRLRLGLEALRVGLESALAAVDRELAEN